MAATGARERHEIRIGKFNDFPERRQTLDFRFQGNQSKSRIVVNHRLYRQLVMHSGEKLAHEHVETAVAAKSNHLARPIEGMDAACLTESGSDGRVVERTDDSLCSVLPYPVGRPQRVRPVSRMKTASPLARSLTARATAWGWMRSGLRSGSACSSNSSSHLRRSLVTRSQKLLLF